jgi:predicted ATPase
MAQRGDWQGQSLGNYRLLQVLGRGHWAWVYLGEHRHLHSQAAIKVLHDPLAPPEVEGFLSEARTLARLRHPHIVRILDFGLQEDIPFLVLDYAPGGTLRTLHPKGTRLPLETVVSYVKQVASALQYAHVQQLIHRDLKPENVLLGPEQQVWLADFGLAVVMQSAASQSLQQTAGTLTYMAPEQLKGLPTVASDQYALGIMIYEWLCGEPPFSGSFSQLAVQHMLTPPPSLTKKVPTLPTGVEHVVFKALAKDPQLRFASVQDCALAFEEACQAETSSGQTLFMPSSHSPGPLAPVAKHNLPAQLTPLIGRDQEVAAVSTLLRRPRVRLLTLVGTGGVGKTRLALQVATDLHADFPDGVYFVSLAPISDAALVMPTIAQTFDLKETAARPLLDLLKAFLGEKHVLLLLDNFEQVLPAAPHLTDLLTSCPHLTILVTSRATLHVGGEHEFPVPPLILPDLTQLLPPETLSDYAAVALFVSRAQATQPTFHLTATNAHAVAKICVQLDGLPLAIELAAARSKLLPPQALLTRLEHRLMLLTSGGQDAPVRQQTLRNTLAWSYDLLSPREQRLFRQLTAFVGGFALEAVEAVCKTLSDEPMHVLEGVASLLDKNLVHRTEQEREEEPRFVLLETVREYGLERLAEAGETETTHEAHAAYYLALAERAELELSSPQQISWFERLERVHDNLRAALSWFLEQGSERQRSELALRLSGALSQFWFIRGYVSEGEYWLERTLDESRGVRSSVRAKALTGAGGLATLQDDFGLVLRLPRERNHLVSRAARF